MSSDLVDIDNLAGILHNTPNWRDARPEMLIMGLTEPFGLQHREFSLPTGIRLHAAERPGSGTPVVFIHGIGGSWRMWLPLLAVDPNIFAGHPLYLVDLRGHGGSDKPETGYTLNDYKSDIIAFIEQLGAPRIILLGHSLGALTSIAAARAVPDRIEKLSLEEPPLPIPTDMSNLGPFWQSLLEWLLGILALKHQPHEVIVAKLQEMEPDLTPEIADVLATQLAEVADGVFKAVADQTFGGYDLLDPEPTVSIPTLLFQGAIPDQRGLADSGVEGLRKIFTQLTLVVIPETGHSIHEKAPVEYRRALAEVLGG